MRFRAELSNVATLQRLVEAAGKLSKRSIIKLTREKLHIIVARESDAGLQVWANIDVKEIFGGEPDSYRIESKSENEIYLELTTAAFLAALKSATSSATRVTLRLSKRGRQPALTIAVTNTSRTGSEYSVTQDLLVRVLKPADMVALAEPLCPEPEVHIFLPSLNQLKNVAERMKNLAVIGKVSANRCGELRVGVETGHVKVETEWRGLKHPDVRPSPSQRPASQRAQPPDTFYSVTLRTKALSTLLSTQAVGGTSIACICEDHALIFYIYLGQPEAPAGILTAYLPALSEDGDD